MIPFFFTENQHDYVDPQSDLLTDTLDRANVIFDKGMQLLYVVKFPSGASHYAAIVLEWQSVYSGPRGHRFNPCLGQLIFP